MGTKVLEIPSFKSSFGSLDWHIPLVLKVAGKERIRFIKSVNKNLEDAFVEFLRSHGRTAQITDRKTLTYYGETFEGRKAHKRYLMSQIYSLAIPSSLNLNLISQQEDREMLTFFGRKLLAFINQAQSDFLRGNEQAMDVLKRIVLYEDQKHWKIKDALSKSRGGLSINELIASLAENGVNTPVSQRAIEWHIRRQYLSEQEKKGLLKTWRDRERLLAQLETEIKQLVEKKVLGARINRVKSLLGIMRSLGIVLEGSGKYDLNNEMLRKIEKTRVWSDIQGISGMHFFETLKRHYEMSAGNQKYVPIPILRDLVCWDLQIPWDVFDDKLMSLGYEYSNHRIILTPPIISKVWGIFKGKKNFYYVSIEEMV